MIDKKIKYNPDWRLIPSYIFSAFINAKTEKIVKNSENLSRANVLSNVSNLK